MSDESDDSVDTVISALDSRLLQSLSASDSLSPEDILPETPTSDSGTTEQLDTMGNRHGGDKKKKKEEEKQPEKPDDKPKRKGKKSKGKSKRHSQHEGEGSSGHGPGACASPSSSSSKSKSKRPDVLADLGTQSPGSPLGSPGSSQGTWSYDDESDVSTVGYSTPLLSTPQVQRCVLPKQPPIQTSTERLEELGRSIERTIIDNLSERPPGEEGAAAASPPSTTSTTESKGKRNVKKKRALGQAVLDSDSFTLPLQDVKPEKAATTSPQTKKLIVGSEKISLRASQECPVSPWLRDDDTPLDEEQMDEMFISCIDLSYNLADICSEKEFTEYGSLESRKQSKADSSRSKETSLSPRIARKTVQSNSSPLPKRVVPKIKAADSRDTPPKSDSSTSTLAEVGFDTREEASKLDCLESTDVSGRGTDIPSQSTIVEADIHEHSQATSVTASCVVNSESGAKPKDAQITKKSGKSKKKSKKKKNRNNEKSVEKRETDIPLNKDISDSTGVSSGDKGNTDSLSESPEHTTTTVNDNLEGSAEINISKAADNSDTKQSVIDTVLDNASNSPEKTLTDDVQNPEPLLDISKYTITRKDEQVQDTCSDKEVVNEEISDKSNNILPEGAVSDVTSDVLKSISESKQTNQIENAQPTKETSGSVTSDGKVVETKQEAPTQSDQAGENLSPPEPASPKHVPPPSPSAMDALAEVDEEDEEALDSLEQTTQLNEVQLFGETVFKRLSSLVESQSQDEDIDDRFKDFSDSVDPDDADSRPVNLGSMGLVGDDMDESIETKTPEMSPEREVRLETSPPKEIVDKMLVPATVTVVERTVVSVHAETIEDVSPISMKKGEESYTEDKDGYIVDDGTLKAKKKRKSSKKKGGKDKSKSKKDKQGNVVRKPEIPVELKQVENTHDSSARTISDETTSVSETDESEKENSPPKRESQQIQDVIEAYGLENIVGVSVETLSDDQDVTLVEDDSIKQRDYLMVRPQYESDDDSEDSCDSRSRSSGDPSTSNSRRIPEIEETFSELLSVKHILEDLEDRTPTEEKLPSFVSSEVLRSPPDYLNGRRSRMSPAITDRTESDLDISEQRDDISTDSMYADDEDDGASEVLFSRSYSEPDGNEVVVSCTFYNTQHNNNTNDSDDFWEDYTTADESFKQIEISADAASSTFQNARKQMHDIHQHLQDLRRQMEHLQEEVEHATLTPEYSMDSEDKRPITE
ncbi:uncharacterized protein LOC124135830 [Haliotis rufescens]|uniref:uncharacterized protein LOC124135830 n=1 Tax=Haliotis rufescens TaxID=6454 RepID=UPI00201F85B8|nr:uncharacterized protein LOC124135830 [Haliotis rufescens]XP_046357397.2 uncharacterized protein LOC124135830 [Haliotis rufescens]